MLMHLCHTAEMMGQGTEELLKWYFAEINDTMQLMSLVGVFRSHFCHAEPWSRYSTSLSQCLPTICFMQVLCSVVLQRGTLG